MCLPIHYACLRTPFSQFSLFQPYKFRGLTFVFSNINSMGYELDLDLVNLILTCEFDEFNLDLYLNSRTFELVLEYGCLDLELWI